MSRAEFITTEFWDEVEDLSPWATLLFVWSWTNDKTNMAGLYRVARRAMTESKCPRQKLDSALEELEDGRFAYYVDGVFWIRNRVKHLAPRGRKNQNPLIARSVAKDVSKIGPDHPLRIRFLEKYGRELWLTDELDKIGAFGSTKGNHEGALKGLPRTPEEAEEDEDADEEVPSLRPVLLGDSVRLPRTGRP